MHNSICLKRLAHPLHSLPSCGTFTALITLSPPPASFAAILSRQFQTTSRDEGFKITEPMCIVLNNAQEVSFKLEVRGQRYFVFEPRGW